ncbi:hypothetical protein BC936DRAFT_139994 [Jimgerdemannia flammicorona]|uniref:Uncharacterized protein n=1 Tax=Jimgerdemannia flammicorona TaxID=994334 RepID=A0A433B7J4_9FUNG|nr:hypothetical protein BC936DRAFT_139994 [Jimgerdemannia flammicorona]
MAYAQNDQEPRHMHPSGKPSDAEDGREEVSGEPLGRTLALVLLRSGRYAGRRAALRDSVGAAALFTCMFRTHIRSSQHRQSLTRTSFPSQRLPGKISDSVD